MTEADGRVLIARADGSSIRGGLEISGIASTAGWGARTRKLVPTENEFHLAGRPNVLESRGIDPLRPRRVIHLRPVPRIYWHHDMREPVGELVELSADPAAIYFRAIVAPPDHPDMDSALLNYIWRGIELRTVCSVSFTCRYEVDGSWDLIELSIVHRGANPAAKITSARYPGGEVFNWAPVPWTPEQIRDASIRHYALYDAKREGEEIEARKNRTPGSATP